MSNRWLVLGAGSWATALALQLNRSGNDVSIWGRDQKQLNHMARSRKNDRYLSSIDLPKTLNICTDLGDAMTHANHILYAIPSQALMTITHKIKPHLKASHRILLSCKGVINLDGNIMPASQYLKSSIDNPVATLSGPSFAIEVAQDQPTAVVIASDDEQWRETACKDFHGGKFRVYASNDLIGVELSGAMKNPLAVAAGIADGLQLGANSRAAIITRGLAEMMRLGVAMGGHQQTFMGLAGMGDLLLTGTSDLSRNRRLGYLIGQGMALDQAQSNIGQAIESLANADLILKAAQSRKIDMPITQAIADILAGRLTCLQAVDMLLDRATKPEYE